MRPFYSEGFRKFRIHPGYIIITKDGCPFATEIPCRTRVPSARMISWCLCTDSGLRYLRNPSSSNQGNVFHLPNLPLALDSIVEFAFKNEGAKAFYRKEMEDIEEEHYENYTAKQMEWLRVTPSIYHPQEVFDKTKRDSNIFEVHSAELWDGMTAEDDSSGWSASLGICLDMNLSSEPETGSGPEEIGSRLPLRIRTQEGSVAGGH